MLIDLKRAYLKRVVDVLKSRGQLQKDLAVLLEESDATLSGRLSGARGIPDDFIDRVQEKTGIPFTVGGMSETVNDPAVIARLVKAVEEQGALLRTLAPLVATILAERGKGGAKG